MWTIQNLSILVPVFIIAGAVLFCAITEYKDKL